MGTGFRTRGVTGHVCPATTQTDHSSQLWPIAMNCRLRASRLAEEERLSLSISIKLHYNRIRRSTSNKSNATSSAWKLGCILASQRFSVREFATAASVPVNHSSTYHERSAGPTLQGGCFTIAPVRGRNSPSTSSEESTVPKSLKRPPA